MKICNERRGIYYNTEYLDGSRAIVSFEMPLSEVVIDFYDRLKSSTRGYAPLITNKKCALDLYLNSIF